MERKDVQAESVIPAPNILLMGPTGTGKTFSIRTLVDCGVTPFCIFTEPGMEVMGDLPPDSYHSHYLSPTPQSWDAIKKMATNVNKLTYEAITKMADPNKNKYVQFLDLCDTTNNFVDDRTGEEFGDCAEWGPDRAIVLDSLTGLSKMAMGLVVGGRPTRAMQDWMVAQNMVEMFIDQLTTRTRCWLIVIAHVEKERNEVTGAFEVMVSTLGQKLAPKIPLFFSDVVLARRDGTDFFWDTAAANTDLKARNLPISSKLDPSFKPIVEKWRSRAYPKQP